MTNDRFKNYSSDATEQNILNILQAITTNVTDENCASKVNYTVQTFDISKELCILLNQVYDLNSITADADNIYLCFTNGEKFLLSIQKA